MTLLFTVNHGTVRIDDNAFNLANADLIKQFRGWGDGNQFEQRDDKAIKCVKRQIKELLGQLTSPYNWSITVHDGSTMPSRDRSLV